MNKNMFKFSLNKKGRAGNTVELNKPIQTLPPLVKLSSILLGGGSLVYFIIFLIFGTKVSFNLGLNHSKALFLDGCLSLVFFCQHSIMVRPTFKNRVCFYIPEHWIPALFSIVSGLTLILVIFFWQNTGAAFIVLPTWLLWIMGCAFFLGLAGLKWGVYSLPAFDPMGIRNQTFKKNQEPVLKIKGPYKHMRHPFYFFTLVLIWSSTEFTIDRIMFNLLWSFWIVIGTWLEERNLVKLFGNDYIIYQKQTPMLLPIKKTILPFKKETHDGPFL
ncbi:MAG: hypothetical protein ABIJ59_09620 [Pseudomonadota bacterium]